MVQAKNKNKKITGGQEKRVKKELSRRSPVKVEAKNSKKPQTKDTKYNIVNILLTVAIVAAVFLLFVSFFSNDQQEEASAPVVEAPQVESEPACYARLLDGVCVENEAKTNIYPVAVMIENYTDARPQYNLTKAQLVYEAVTEGGIPRFMAVYANDDEIEKIGPVRSARPYFVEWAEEIKAMYWHSGGSPVAIAYLGASDLVYNVDEFYRGDYYWRDDNLARPHNLFTSSELINAYKERVGVDRAEDFETWSFVDEPEVIDMEDPVTEVSYNYSPYDNYFTQWKYNQEDNTYYRYQVSEEHLDANGEQVSAKNLIIQYIPTESIDNLDRKEIKTIGEGKILIFQNGSVEEGTWDKENKKDRTKYLGSDGQPVEFNRGTTWIIAMPTDEEVSY